MISTMLLIASMVLAPWIAGGMGELADGVVQIIVYLSAASFIFISLKSKNAALTLPAGGLLFGFFLILAVLSNLFTECAYFSITGWMYWFGCLTAFLLASQLFNDRKKALLPLTIMTLVSTAICLMAIRNQAIMSGGGADFWAEITSGEEIRFFGTFINPNFFGGFLVITVPIAIALFLMSEGLAGAVIFGIAVISQLFAITLTSSKFSIIALLIALIIFAVPCVAKRYISRLQWVKLGSVLLLSLALLIPASASLRTRVSESTGDGTQVHSTKFRLYTWKATAKMIVAKPLTGVGMGNYTTAFPRFAIAGLTNHAHQSFLQLGAENGVLVLGVFVAGLVAAAAAGIKNVFKAKPEKDAGIFAEIINTEKMPILGWAIIGGLAGSTVRNLVDSDWYIMGIGLTFWICAGVLLGTFAESRKPIKTGPHIKWIYVLFGVCVLASAKFAVGDYYANSTDTPNRYAKADAAAIINPLYKKQLAMRELVTPKAAEIELRKAIKLAPKDASNYYLLSILQQPEDSIESLKKSLEYNPHSTQALRALAQIYDVVGDVKSKEAVYQRMIAQENSPYERVKGIPELVDTNYVYAHQYFADKYMKQKDYEQAAQNLEQACNRLERWKNAGVFLKVARVSGQLSESEEQQKLLLLKTCYTQLIECYSKLDKDQEALEVSSKLDELD